MLQFFQLPPKMSFVTSQWTRTISAQLILESKFVAVNRADFDMLKVRRSPGSQKWKLATK